MLRVFLLILVLRARFLFWWKSPPLPMDLLLLDPLPCQLLTLLYPLPSRSKPFFSCGILLGRSGMRYHARIHRQTLGTALPGRAEGSIEGTGGEIWSRFSGGSRPGRPVGAYLESHSRTSLEPACDRVRRPGTLAQPTAAEGSGKDEPRRNSRWTTTCSLSKHGRDVDWHFIATSPATKVRGVAIL